MSSTLRECASDAIKFWERWRIAYNLVLAVIVIIYFAHNYPSSRTALSLNLCLGLFLLVVVANIAYCAAYIVDVFAQWSGFRDLWQRYRWLLFVIGTVFASILTRFVAMGMFQSGGR